MAVTSSTTGWDSTHIMTSGTGVSPTFSASTWEPTVVYTTLGTSYYPDPRRKEAQRRIMEALVNDIVRAAYPDADLAR